MSGRDLICGSSHSRCTFLPSPHSLFCVYLQSWNWWLLLASRVLISWFLRSVLEYDQTVTCHKCQGGKVLCLQRGCWTRAVPKKSHVVSSQSAEASCLSCSSSCFLKVRLPKVHCNNNFSLKMPHKQFDRRLKAKERSSRSLM